MPGADTSQARPLTSDDLNRVIAIDAELSGRERPIFFQKRLDAALNAPDGFITAAVDGTGGIDGYAIARIQSGEFGSDHAVAVLDVIGVDPGATHRGIGHALMARLDARMRKRGVREMRTQADWRHHELLRFFEDVGFGLAPFHILQRDNSDPVDF